jgi:hypothetical protein
MKHGTGCITLFVLAAAGCGAPVMHDISPNAVPNFPGSQSYSTAGLTLELAGDSDDLYAVSLNAGIWKSHSGDPWTQLSGSPRYARTMTVDPANHSRIAVGERNGDSRDVRLESAGIWESLDAGTHWTYVLDPLSIPECRSQAVAAVAYASNANLVAATACGIAVRGAGNQWSFPSLPGADGAPTALAVAGVTVWARTASGLLYSSTDGGASWTRVATATPFPSASLRSSPFSLAATGQTVYMAADNLPGVGLFAYDAGKGTWLAGPVVDDATAIHLPNGGERLPSPVGDGRVSVGQLVVRAKDWGRPGFSVVLFSAAENLWRVSGSDTAPDGTTRWHATMLAACATTRLCTTAPPTGAGPRVHDDFWDMLADSPQTGIIWLATDGGVYQHQGDSWLPIANGMHTHHVNSLDIALSSPVRIGYAASDNDAWYYTNGPAWAVVGCCGDGNWSDGDAANAKWMLFARTAESRTSGDPCGKPGATMQAIDGASPTRWGIVLASNPGGQERLTFIQTPADETATDLDAVVLVNRPLTDNCGKPVGGPLTSVATGGGQALIRNKTWSQSPDLALGYTGWIVEATELPAGSLLFWVAGGHANPAYFVLANEKDPSGNPIESLYRRKADGTWGTPIFRGVAPWNPSLIHEWYGPVFPNPYDANAITLMTATDVLTTTDGASFARDNVLSQLVTGSGQYALRTDFGADPSYDGKLQFIRATRSLSLGTISQIAYDQANPRKRAVAASSVGVFYDNGSGVWRDITPLLPHPLSPVTAVRVAGDAVYVAFAGRSVVRVDDAGDARLAAYYDIDPSAPNGVVAKLRRSDGKSMAAATVTLTFVDAQRGRVVSSQKVGASGEVVLPISNSHGGAIFLDFAGDDLTAPARTSFLVP